MNRRIKKKILKRYGIRKYKTFNILKNIISKCNSIPIIMNPNMGYPLTDVHKMITFRDYGTAIQIIPRLPTDIECRKYLINILFDMRLRDEIGTVQYRTVKGQIRRGYIDIGINFISNQKHVPKEQIEHLYNEYRQRTIYEMVLTYKANTPVDSEAIDIIHLGKLNVNERNDENEI